MAADILASSSGGAWKSTEDVEDNLTLDELLMVSKQINRNRWHDWKFHAAIQGIQMDDAFDEEDHTTDEELPPELIEREREWQRKKKEHLESKGSEHQFKDMGLGYIKK